MRSNSSARRRTCSNIVMCNPIGSRIESSRRNARGQMALSSADVRESPLANSMTSCPSATSSSVSQEMTRSVPPYRLGGTASVSGEICAMRIRTPYSPPSPGRLGHEKYPTKNNLQLENYSTTIALVINGMVVVAGMAISGTDDLCRFATRPLAFITRYLRQRPLSHIAIVTAVLAAVGHDAIRHQGLD